MVGFVGVAGSAVLAGSHREGRAQEGGEIPDLVEDTSLAEHHMACQEIQGQDHRDPSQPVEEGRMEDTEGVDRKDRQGGHLEVGGLAVEVPVEVVLVGFDVEPAPELVLEGETRSIGKLD